VPDRPYVAIVDYGLGNLFSVRQACAHVGLDVAITSDATTILSADGVILPGIGAFGDAMATLRRLDLVGVLRDVAASSTPLLGVCLGMQLLATESDEFGRHPGLDVVPGRVIRLAAQNDRGRLKIPHVGWSAIHPARPGAWRGGLLEEVAEGAFMYFVHSFHLETCAGGVVVATTRYGDTEYAAALTHGSVFACQFHPERSGLAGLSIYRAFAARVRTRRAEGVHAG